MLGTEIVVVYQHLDQQVTLHDIGSEAEIVKWARFCNAEVTIMDLVSQFRCSGSDGYLAWLDHTLQIKETANPTLSTQEYDFQVFDDPGKLRDVIFEKNKERNKARLLAGICWNWISKRDTTKMDIVMPEYDFAMRWNLGSDEMLWMIKPESACNPISSLSQTQPGIQKAA